MKKLNIGLPLLCLLFSSVFAQTSLPFPDSMAVWHSKFFWVFNNGSGVYDDMTAGTLGDTLIGGLHYQKIGDHLNYSNASFVPASATLRASARSQGDKWYFIPAGDTTQYMLYDFGVALGDTVTITNPVYQSWNGDSTHSFKVWMMDSVQVAGGFRKKIILRELTENWFEEWIEGIGSKKGLLYSGTSTVDGYRQMLCFSDNGSVIYINSPDSTCTYSPIGVEDELEPSQAFVYPNPAVQQINIRVANYPTVEFHFTLSDLTGRKVISQNFTQNQYTILRNGLPAGIYLYQLSTGDAILEKGKLLLLSSE
ncbi:MAG: T9SS type A sorting domain-containing protein [Bacteroidia bacterium]|nr:T9SS type A sorting domain-containing protein [Bacteroidia bacterium]